MQREKKAEEYFADKSYEQVEKWIPEYQKIIVGLSRLLQEIPSMSEDEIFNGFTEVNNK